MKTHLIAALALAALPAFAQFPDTKALQGAAEKAAGEAGKQAAADAEAKAKAEGKKAATEQVENKVNDKLMEEAKKNQCAFKSNSDQFQGKCDKEVQRIFDALIEAKKALKEAGISGFKFEVSGHTDTKGKADANKKLSLKRAAKMVAELKKKGVPANEIIAVGMGSEKPLVKPDDTKEKQAMNRRYEVRVRLSTP